MKFKILTAFFKQKLVLKGKIIFLELLFLIKEVNTTKLKALTQ